MACPLVVLAHTMRRASDKFARAKRSLRRLSAHAQYWLRLVVERRFPGPVARHVGPHQLNGAYIVSVQGYSQAEVGVGMVYLHDLYCRNAQEIEAGSRSERPFGHRLRDEMAQQGQSPFRCHAGSDEFG